MFVAIHPHLCDKVCVRVCVSPFGLAFLCCSLLFLRFLLFSFFSCVSCCFPSILAFSTMLSFSFCAFFALCLPRSFLSTRLTLFLSLSLSSLNMSTPHYVHVLLFLARCLTTGSVRGISECAAQSPRESGTYLSSSTALPSILLLCRIYERQKGHEFLICTKEGASQGRWQDRLVCCANVLRASLTSLSSKPRKHHGFTFVIMICGFLLPPLAVAIRFGIGKDFFINIICTLCGYIPGHVRRENGNATCCSPLLLGPQLLYPYVARMTLFMTD